MAFKRILSRFQQKQDTEANWESNNLVQLDGELAIAKDGSGEIRLKVGDGQKQFTQLAYIDEPVRQSLASMQTQLSNKVDLLNGKVHPEQSTSNTRW